jgi:V/A-type H+/Na+-transporting ATPase subunit E
MELDLAGVIEKIKSEGVEKADLKALEIIQEAEQKAKDILKKAEEQKKEMIEEGQKEIESFGINADKEMRQASRKVTIALKAQIIALFDRLIKNEVKEQMTPNMLKELIVKVVLQSAGSKTVDLEILLNEKDQEVLSQTLNAALKEKIEKGITIKTASAIEKGFRIGTKGTNLYYDFTDEAIAETFHFYLSKKVKDILVKEEQKDE